VHTRDSLAADFRALGLTAGQTVLVHAAMRPVGPVAVPVGAASGRMAPTAGWGRPAAWRAPTWARSAQASLHQGFRSWFRPAAEVRGAVPGDALAGALAVAGAVAPAELAVSPELAVPAEAVVFAAGEAALTPGAATGFGAARRLAAATPTAPGPTAPVRRRAAAPVPVASVAPAPVPVAPAPVAPASLDAAAPARAARPTGSRWSAAPAPDEPRGPRRADATAETVLHALRDVLGPEGTVVVPAFTESNSDTSRAHREATAGMTPGEAARYRAAMPPFDPARSPSERVGRLAETLRTTPGALRSGHPQTSFAALGRDAEAIVGGHDPTDHLGERSPVARLYDAEAVVLLIGVGFGVCTAFHLAEYRIPDTPLRDYRCVVMREGDGARGGKSGDAGQWITYRDIVLDDSDFPQLGAAFERSGARVERGPVGDADSRCLPLKDAVDFAGRWLSENRRPGSGRM
jgi:aminoglycoside 3-N-acetyltransferase